MIDYTPTYEWYYNSSNDRSPSWTEIVYLYQFLMQNKGPGSFATGTDASETMPGDIIQLGDQTDRFYHSPIVMAAEPSEIYVVAHAFDAFMHPLSSYIYDRSRFLRIEGIREYQ